MRAIQEFEAYCSFITPDPQTGAIDKTILASASGSYYWEVYGSKRFPLLSTIARRLMCTPTSSAASERIWSVFGFIHSKRRANLKSLTTMKLASVYANTTLALEYSAKKAAEEAKAKNPEVEVKVAEVYNYIEADLYGEEEQDDDVVEKPSKSNAEQPGPNENNSIEEN